MIGTLYFSQQILSIVHPFADFHPLQKYAKSAVDNISNDFAKYIIELPYSSSITESIISNGSFTFSFILSYLEFISSLIFFD